MSSFFTILRKHIWILWLAHILGNLALLPIEFFIGLSDFLVQEYLLDLSISGRTYSASTLLFFMQQPEMSYGNLLWKIIYTFIAFLIFTFALSGSLGVCIEALRNHQVRIYQYFHYGFDFLHKTTLLFFILLSGFSLLVAFVYWVTAILSYNWLKIAFLIVVSLFIISYLLGSLYAVVILIAEKTRVLQSIQFSFKLLFRDFWKVLLAAVLFFPFIALDIWMADQSENSISSFQEFITSPFNDLLYTLLIEPPVMLLSSFFMLFLYFHHLRRRIKHELPPSISTTSSWLPIQKK